MRFYMETLEKNAIFWTGVNRGQSWTIFEVSFTQIGQSSPDLEGFIPFVPAAKKCSTFLPLYSFLYIGTG